MATSSASLRLSAMLQAVSLSTRGPYRSLVAGDRRRQFTHGVHLEGDGQDRSPHIALAAWPPGADVTGDLASSAYGDGGWGTYRSSSERT